MNHAALPLTDSGIWTKISASKSDRRTGWMDRFSQGVATAVVFGLLIAMVGGAFIRQNGLWNGNDEPANIAGVAASPEATPADAALACGSPGYRPVVEGEVTTGDLALIGTTEEPIIESDEVIVVPLSGGGTRELSAGSMLDFEAGTGLTVHDDHSVTLTRISDGTTWEFPTVQPAEHNLVEVRDNGRYFIGPNNDQRTDWMIVDTKTGTVRTTSDILGGPFEGRLLPFDTSSSDDNSVLATGFVSATFESETPEPTRADPAFLVIPGSLEEAYFFDTMTTSPSVSPDGAFVSTGEQILDSETGEAVNPNGVGDFFLGKVVGFTEDSRLITVVSNEVHSIEPVSGEEHVIFTADGEIWTILQDVSAGTLAIGAGSTESLHWTFLNVADQTSTPLPELDDYRLNGPRPSGETYQVERLAVLVQQNGSNTFMVRALDMHTADVSSAVSERFIPNVEDGMPQFFPISAEGDFATAISPDGKITLIDPSNDSLIEFDSPDARSIGQDANLRTSISPNGNCILLNELNEEYEITGTSWIAPIEPGAEWTKLDIQLTGWVELPDDEQETETLPAQEFATPLATPETQTVPCASPGYRPIMEFNDGVTVPLPDGERRELPPGSVAYPEAGTALTVADDGSATATRLSDGETWDTPAVSPRVYDGYFEIMSNGRYFIAPNNDERMDWIIIDTVTGDTRTTSDILGESFDGGLNPWITSSSDDGSVMAVQFIPAAFEGGTPEPVDDVPGFLVISGSLDDAYFYDKTTRTMTVSPDGTHIVTFNQVLNAPTGERIGESTVGGFFSSQIVAFIDDSTLLTRVSNEVHRIDIVTGQDEIIFTADSQIEAIAHDGEVSRIAVGTGEPGSERWTLVDLDSGQASPLPELDGFRLNVTAQQGAVRPGADVADFVQQDDPETFSVRALDLRTGSVSSPVSTSFTRDPDESVPTVYPSQVHDDVVTVQDSQWNITTIDPATGSVIELAKPENLLLGDDTRLEVSVSPGGQCIVLNAYEPNTRLTGNSFIAPVASDATWIQLEFRITGWVEVDN